MKSILCLGICFLLLSIPVATAISNTNEVNVKIKNKNIIQENLEVKRKNIPQKTDVPPNWANGNFSGEWGFDIWGEWNIPLGWMYGYYNRDRPNLGYFYAGLVEFGHENISWYLQGIFFGPFMFGSIGENESANETLFVGIGRYDDTNYHWRVMGEIGPTFFMDGIYTKFE